MFVARSTDLADQAIQRNREFSHAHPSSVPNGVRDRTGRAGDPDLADALDAERVDVWIMFLDQERFERRHIGAYRNVVLGQIGVHRTAGPRIHNGLLVQRKRYAPDHSAIELALHHARIDDASGRKGADHARGADLSEIGINLDLGEHGAMCMHGVARLGGRIGRTRAATFDLRESGAAENIGVALAAAFVVATTQPAAPRDDAGIAGAEQRRAFVVQCKLGEPSDHVGTGVVDRRAGSRGVGGAARDAGIGKVGGTGTELELLDIERKGIGRDLRQRRPGALPHVVRADLHDAAAVATQHRLGVAREHQRRKRRGADAPADEQSVTVAHRPRREGAALPAEALGRPPVAFAQSLRGKRLTGDRLDLGIVLEPKRQRIHAAGLRHLVDGAFERDRACRLAGSAHEHWRADVGPNGFVRGCDGGARVGRMGGTGSRLEEIVECARHRPGAMIDRNQLAVLVGAQAQGLPRRRPVADRTVHLLAPQHELDRLPDHAGRDDAENLRSGDQAFAAETAAEKRAADVNVVRQYSEQARKTPLRNSETLGRRVDRKVVAVPGGDDRMRLHRIVILCRGLVGLGDRPCRRRKPCLDVAAMHLCRKAGADGRRHEAFGRIEPDPRRLDLVARREQGGAFGCGFKCFRDHDGDGLIGVTDPVALQEIEPKREEIRSLIRIPGERRPVRRRDHLDDAGMGLRGRDIEKGNPPARDARHRKHHIEHAGRMAVGGILGGARHLEHAFAAGERLSHVRAMPNVGGCS